MQQDDSLKLIYSIYENLPEIYNLYKKNLHNILSEEEVESIFSEEGAEIEGNLLELAACQLCEKKGLNLTTNFEEYKAEVIKKYIEKLDLIKKAMAEAGFENSEEVGAKLLKFIETEEKPKRYRKKKK